jgi:uncharacterized protein YggE
MAISIKPGYRAAAVGVASAALHVGAFSIGASHGSSPAAQAATLTAAPTGPARITVTGVGTVTGTPDQLVLSMGVQVNGASVSSALDEANHAVSQVTAALTQRGVAAADIQTSGLAIWPNYQANSQVPASYGASESLTATLDNLSVAGSQIEAAVHAGGNAVTVNNVSLNLADNSSLLASARANAVTDARTKAAQFARALGETLGPVISISSADQSPPIMFGAQASASAAKASSVPISPGSQQVSVSITVVFAA